LSVKILKNTDTHKENRILYETGMEKLGFFDLETKSLTMPRHLPANYLVGKIQPQECVVKSLGVIFQPTLFAKAFFKNIKASDGNDEGVFEKLLNTQYSATFSPHHIPHVYM
jgi:hypothetical protein